MADDQSGPVRPPTIELEAKPAGSGRSKTLAGAKRKAAERARASAVGGVETVPGETPPLEEPAAEIPEPVEEHLARPGLPLDVVLVSAGLGAGGALIIAFLLALVGWWPGAGTSVVVADAGLEDRIAALEATEAIDTSTFAERNDVAALSARLEALENAAPLDVSGFAGNSEIADLRQELATLSASPSVDVAARSQIERIEARLAALEAAPESPDGVALADDIARLEAEIQVLSQASAAPANMATIEDVARLDAAIAELAAAPAPADPADAAARDVRLAALEADFAALKVEMAGNGAASSATPTPLADLEAARRAALLPLVIDALEREFETGAPYRTALANLRSGLPRLSVPPAIIDAAATGLDTAEELAAEVALAAPAMLQAEAASNPEADIFARIWEQVAAAVALRPEGEPLGHDAASILARLENALARGDLEAASAEFEALPEAMKAEATEVGLSLRLAGSARNLVAAARQAALAEANL